MLDPSTYSRDTIREDRIRFGAHGIESGSVHFMHLGAAPFRSRFDEYPGQYGFENMVRVISVYILVMIITLLPPLLP